MDKENTSSNYNTSGGGGTYHDLFYRFGNHPDDKSLSSYLLSQTYNQSSHVMQTSGEMLDSQYMRMLNERKFVQELKEKEALNTSNLQILKQRCAQIIKNRKEQLKFQESTENADLSLNSYQEETQTPPLYHLPTTTFEDYNQESMLLDSASSSNGIHSRMKQYIERSLSSGLRIYQPTSTSKIITENQYSDQQKSPIVEQFHNKNSFGPQHIDQASDASSSKSEIPLPTPQYGQESKYQSIEEMTFQQTIKPEQQCYNRQSNQISQISKKDSASPYRDNHFQGTEHSIVVVSSNTQPPRQYDSLAYHDAEEQQLLCEIERIEAQLKLTSNSTTTNNVSQYLKQNTTGKEMMKGRNRYDFSKIVVDSTLQSNKDSARQLVVTDQTGVLNHIMVGTSSTINGQFDLTERITLYPVANSSFAETRSNPPRKEQFLQRQIEWLQKKNERLQIQQQQKQSIKQKEEERECTFKPKIHYLETQKQTRKKSRSLSQNNAKTVEKQAVKQQQQSPKFFREQIFRGSTSKSPRTYREMSERKVERENRVEERLMVWNKKQKEKLIYQAHRLSVERDKECTFIPKINAKAPDSKSPVPVSKTPREVKFDQRLFLSQKTASQSPTLTKRQVLLSMEDFQKRNSEWQAKKEFKRSILTEEILDKESRNNTFQPQINQMSQIIHQQKLLVIETQRKLEKHSQMPLQIVKKQSRSPRLSHRKTSVTPQSAALYYQPLSQIHYDNTQPSPRQINVIPMQEIQPIQSTNIQIEDNTMEDQEFSREFKEDFRRASTADFARGVRESIQQKLNQSSLLLSLNSRSGVESSQHYIGSNRGAPHLEAPSMSEIPQVEYQPEIQRPISQQQQYAVNIEQERDEFNLLIGALSDKLSLHEKYPSHHHSATPSVQEVLPYFRSNGANNSSKVIFDAYRRGSSYAIYSGAGSSSLSNNHFSDANSNSQRTSNMSGIKNLTQRLKDSITMSKRQMDDEIINTQRAANMPLSNYNVTSARSTLSNLKAPR